MHKFTRMIRGLSRDDWFEIIVVAVLALGTLGILIAVGW